MRPIFIPEPQINFTKNFTLFSKIIVKLSSRFIVSDWWNWVYFRAKFWKFWKYDPCLYQFLHWIRGHHYTRRLILRPISAARPRIDLCTKNSPWAWTPSRYTLSSLHSLGALLSNFMDIYPTRPCNYSRGHSPSTGMCGPQDPLFTPLLHVTPSWGTSPSTRPPFERKMWHFLFKANIF